MLSQTLQIVRRNWVCYVILIVVEVAGNIFEAFIGQQQYIPLFIMSVMLSLFVQTAVLSGNLSFNETFKKCDILYKYFIPYTAKYIAVAILSFLGLLTVFMCSYMIKNPTDARFSDDSSLMLFLWITIMLAFLAFAALFSLIGTWLPATLYRQNTSLRDAFRRGKASFFRTWGYVSAGMIFSMVTAVLLNGAVIYVFVDENLTLPSDAQWIKSVINVSIGLLNTTWIAVVLANVYKKAEIDPFTTSLPQTA